MECREIEMWTRLAGCVPYSPPNLLIITLSQLTEKPLRVVLSICLSVLLSLHVLTPQMHAQPAANEAPSSESPTVRTVQIAFDANGIAHDSIGEVVVEYADGNMLLQTADGQLWTLKSDQINSVTDVDEPMEPDTAEALFERFKSELPKGFKVYKTRHYVLVYNTSDIYVRWVGELFERLYKGFYNYWSKRRIEMQEPRFPLVAVVFRDKASYLQYGHQDIGRSADAMIGYYNMKTNRMSMYDLTGIDGMVPEGRRVASTLVINNILSQPQAERTVATIVHEAVHQLAFNSGMQTRLADNPLWFSEGLAMFFESPDRGSTTGWRDIGKVNYHNLALFQKNFRSRQRGSLTSLLTNDTRLQNSRDAARAYPESWALTYFLIKTRNKQYVAYLKDLALLPPLGKSTERERVELFRSHFGELDKLEASFLTYMSRLR